MKKNKTAFTHPLPEMIEVEWIDSACTAGWMDHDDSQGVKALHCRSVGYIVRQTKHALTLVQSVDEQDPARKCQATTIPAVAIKWMRRLK